MDANEDLGFILKRHSLQKKIDTVYISRIISEEIGMQLTPGSLPYFVASLEEVNDTALSNPPLITRTDNCVNQYKHV